MFELARPPPRVRLKFVVSMPIAAALLATRAEKLVGPVAGPVLPVVAAVGSYDLAAYQATAEADLIASMRPYRGPTGGFQVAA